MLVPKLSEWKLEHLGQYGMEIQGKLGQVVQVNQGSPCLAPKKQTNWLAVQAKLGIGHDVKCKCGKCTEKQ
jgi:hypothetical protein